MPDLEIESLRESLKLPRCEPHPYLVVGSRVRIKKGALAGKDGIVLRTKNRCRVVLTLSLIMRSFAVEVDATDLDFIGCSTAAPRRLGYIPKPAPGTDP